MPHFCTFSKFSTLGAEWLPQLLVISKHIAQIVAEQACAEGVADVDKNVDLEQLIDQQFWQPQYYPLKKG